MVLIAVSSISVLPLFGINNIFVVFSLYIFQSFYDLSLPEAIPRVNINMPHSYENVMIFVHKLKEQIKRTKLYPDSSSQINSHQMTSQNSHSAWHHEQGTIFSSSSVPSFHKPASESKFKSDFGTPYKPATKSKKQIRLCHPCQDSCRIPNHICISINTCHPIPIPIPIHPWSHIKTYH